MGYNGFTRGAATFGRLYGSVGIDKHIVLGHDAAACLLVDGVLSAAIEEERLNREKKTSDFPVESMKWCLRQADMRFEDIDIVAFPWNFSADVVDATLFEMCIAPLEPVQKLERLRRFGDLYTTILSREAILADFANRTGYQLPPEKIALVPHHLAHLMCGYHLAGARDTAFLISDGRSERCSSIMGEIRNGRVRVFEEATVGADNSIAMLFTSVTRHLGFIPNNDEYKVMGLSAFSEPPSPNPLLEHVVTLTENGRYTLDHQMELPGLLERYFGPARDDLEYKARVAAAAQQMVEVVTAHRIRALEAKTNLSQLVFEGGLALNCVNNTKLLEGSRFDDMAVSFAASDPGVSLGAALYACADGARPNTTITPYLGPTYNDEILPALQGFADCIEWMELSDDQVIDQTAKLLTTKTVIAWYQDRIEYGPRALGNRSILANPNFPDIKDVINTRVKHREPFRPFAPVVLERDAPRVFQMGRKSSSPYMTFVFPVRAEYRQTIPGACHVDGTARIQTVTDRENYRLAALLRRFTELTNVPCLINTSFNVAGEPIVCTPADALKCFLGTDIDYLVLGNFLVTKGRTHVRA
jgi:carbamoyltransferase